MKTLQGWESCKSNDSLGEVVELVPVYIDFFNLLKFTHVMGKVIHGVVT